MRTCSALGMLLATLTFSGCGQAPPAANNAPTAPADATASTSALTRRDVSSVKMGEYAPPLDGDRIELATPDGWKWAPRSNDYLMQFVKEGGGGALPRIKVVVEENNLGGLTDLTEANAVEFTAAVAKDLAAGKTLVDEAPLPMVIGSVPCVRYVSITKVQIGGGKELAKRQTLVLLHAGRLYKIDLLAYPNKFLDDRDAAYAVCASVRFLAAEAPAIESPAAAIPTAETPTAEAPAAE